MSRLIVRPVVWELICPKCEDVIPSPFTGSQLWTGEDMSKTDVVKCCGQRMTLPARLRSAL